VPKVLKKAATFRGNFPKYGALKVTCRNKNKEKTAETALAGAGKHPKPGVSKMCNSYKNISSFFVSNHYFLEAPLIVERPDPSSLLPLLN